MPIQTFPPTKYERVGVWAKVLVQVTAVQGVPIGAALIHTVPSAPSVFIVMLAAHQFESETPFAYAIPTPGWK